MRKASLVDFQPDRQVELAVSGHEDRPPAPACGSRRPTARRCPCRPAVRALTDRITGAGGGVDQDEAPPASRPGSSPAAAGVRCRGRSTYVVPAGHRPDQARSGPERPGSAPMPNTSATASATAALARLARPGSGRWSGQATAGRVEDVVADQRPVGRGPAEACTHRSTSPSPCAAQVRRRSSGSDQESSCQRWPAATQVTWRAGQAAHATSGSSALAMTRQSGAGQGLAPAARRASRSPPRGPSGRGSGSAARPPGAGRRRASPVGTSRRPRARPGWRPGPRPARRRARPACWRRTRWTRSAGRAARSAAGDEPGRGGLAVRARHQDDLPPAGEQREQVGLEPQADDPADDRSVAAASQPRCPAGGAADRGGQAGPEGKAGTPGRRAASAHLGPDAIRSRSRARPEPGRREPRKSQRPAR